MSGARSSAHPQVEEPVQDRPARRPRPAARWWRASWTRSPKPCSSGASVQRQREVRRGGAGPAGRGPAARRSVGAGDRSSSSAWHPQRRWFSSQRPIPRVVPLVPGQPGLEPLLEGRTGAGRVGASTDVPATGRTWASRRRSASSEPRTSGHPWSVADRRQHRDPVLVVGVEPGDPPLRRTTGCRPPRELAGGGGTHRERRGTRRAGPTLGWRSSRGAGLGQRRQRRPDRQAERAPLVGELDDAVAGRLCGPEGRRAGDGDDAHVEWTVVRTHPTVGHMIRCSSGAMTASTATAGRSSRCRVLTRAS